MYMCAYLSLSLYIYIYIYICVLRLVAAEGDLARAVVREEDGELA